ncbi:ATP-dependent DNA helicase homolog RECG, chloroplastic isoform X2 [Beta vulgaris subsp. vulgaris]|nr:ATP-dependent DNA helicase homolog RECG, chloroplastic isoform X2 [Beta vulgaris subsp. vulgaris]
MLGYSKLDGLVNGRSQKESGVVLKDGLDTFDVSIMCKIFPSIIIGSSPPVELYNDSAWHSQIRTYSPVLSSEEFQPILTEGKWMIPETLTEMGPSLNYKVPNMSSSCEEVSFPSPFQTQSDGMEDQQFGFPGSGESPAPPMVLEKDKLSRLILDKPISFIEGLSKRQTRQLEDCDFHTLRKLLHHFPRTYADLQNLNMGIEDGQYLIFVGRVLSSRAIKASYSLSFLEVVVCGKVDLVAIDEVEQDGIKGEGKKIIYIHLKKFFRGTRFTSQGFLRCVEKKHIEGDIVCVSGKVRGTSKEDHYEMKEYSLDLIENEDDPSVPMNGRPYPIYPSKGSLKPQFFRDIMTRALQSLHSNIDPIPEDITIDIGLPGLHDAYIAIHQPKDLDHADLARRRFIFDEFFYLQLGRMYQMLEGLGSRIEKEGLLERYRHMEQSSIFTEEWCDLTKRFFDALPYSLTKGQLSAASEIICDLKRPVPMNRLLQGDVGCGKTVVAFLTCMEVVGSGYQAAYMVPTELLAVQHYEELSNLLENMESASKPSITLLTGSTPTKQAQMIRNELQAGTISLVIGTHSLIAESVEFLALRLAVIDEQHRFGVIQRGRFNSKLCCASTSSGTGSASFGGATKVEIQMAPHVLAMSATPIPRSLALALYGDMSLTQITDLPPGRLPIDTRIIEGDENGFEKVYEIMLQELEVGGKVYLVYPVIEQSEQLPQLRAASGDYDTICSKFPNYKCGLLHGRMKGDEKDKALKCFRDGETQILLSTIVIETGIDVPDASMMVVMNAERFGMAQLHQLRGRVGRGTRKSKCILVASTASSLGRLKVLQHSSDGFHLAKVDLLLRGPGDLLGKKQSGHLPDFPITRLEIDGSIIQDAHVAALKILSTSHDLELFPELKAELSMRQPLSILGD